MTEDKIRKLKFIYGIGVSALTAIVGGLFILQVWSIFFSAERSPFTYEIIGEKFIQILAPVCLWLLAIVGGGVIGCLYPDQKTPLKGYVPASVTLARLKARLPQEEGGMSALKRGKWSKIILRASAGVACLMMILTVFAVLLDPAYVPLTNVEFLTDHNGVADRLVHICIFVGGCSCTCLIAVFTEAYILQQEIVVLKAKLAENAQKGIKPQKAETKKDLWTRIIEKYPLLQSKWWKQGLQIGICAVGVALFVVGIFNGGMADVFEKARNICTQCIGLG